MGSDPELLKTRKPAQSAGFFVTTNERSLLLLLGAALLRSLLFLRSHCSLHGEGVERRSNPPVDWSAAAGCEHPTGSARLTFGAILRQTSLFNQHVMQGYEPHDDRLVDPKLRNKSGIATRQS